MSWLLALRTIAALVLKRAVGLIRRLFAHPLQLLCIGLAVWVAWLLLLTIPAKDAALSKRSAELQAEADAHVQTRENYATAQLIAEQAARHQIATLEARYKELAHHADAQFAAGQAAALAAADRYIAANRLPVDASAAAAVGASGTTAATSPDRDSGGADRSGRSAQLVAVTADDLRICTLNTARLIDAHEWALALASVVDDLP